MRSQTTELYLSLLEGKTLRIPDLSEQEYRTIRKALNRHHKLMVEIGGSDLSVIGSFNSRKYTGTFRLGKKPSRANYTVEIVEEKSDEEICGVVEKISRE